MHTERWSYHSLIPWLFRGLQWCTWKITYSSHKTHLNTSMLESTLFHSVWETDRIDTIYSKCAWLIGIHIQPTSESFLFPCSSAWVLLFLSAACLAVELLFCTVFSSLVAGFCLLSLARGTSWNCVMFGEIFSVSCRGGGVLAKLLLGVKHSAW